MANNRNVRIDPFSLESVITQGTGYHFQWEFSIETLIYLVQWKLLYLAVAWSKFPSEVLIESMFLLNWQAKHSQGALYWIKNVTLTFFPSMWQHARIYSESDVIITYLFSIFILTLACHLLRNICCLPSAYSTAASHQDKFCSCESCFKSLKTNKRKSWNNECSRLSTYHRKNNHFTTEPHDIIAILECPRECMCF